MSHMTYAQLVRTVKLDSLSTAENECAMTAAVWLWVAMTEKVRQ